MKLEWAPESGQMAAYYRDRVIYESYQKDRLPSEDLLKQDLLELHLFDENKEYRYVLTGSGEIEALISDEQVSFDDQYTEKIFTEKGEKIEVVNYMRYDQNDLIQMINYRLKKVDTDE